MVCCMAMLSDGWLRGPNGSLRATRCGKLPIFVEADMGNADR